MAQVIAQDDAAVVADNRAKRLVLLALAALCVVLAVFILAFNLGFASRSQNTTNTYVESSTQGQGVADVLLIMSYSEAEANTPLARNGVLGTMADYDVNVDVVYMDAYNAPLNSAAYGVWVDQVRQKLASHGGYNAVICCDDEALYFMESNHATLFGSTPVVFFGINDFAHAVSASRNGYSTGMLEQSYMASMMETTCSMHPDATSFTVVVDTTPAGVGNKAQFDSAMQGFSNMGVRYIDASSLTRSELASIVASAREDTIVFLLDANTDRQGNVYSLDDSVAHVTSSSNVPVYRASIGGVGNGIAGSAYLDPESDGRQAALMTIDVLNGSSPSSIPLVVDGTLGYVFDGQVLADYGVSTLNVPFGSTIVNRQLFSFDTLRAAFVPVLLLLLALLLYMRARKIAPRLATEAGTVNAQVIDPDAAPDNGVVNAVAVAERPTAAAKTKGPKSKKGMRKAERRAARKARQAEAERAASISQEVEPEPIVEEETVEPAQEVEQASAFEASMEEGAPADIASASEPVEETQELSVEQETAATPAIARPERKAHKIEHKRELRKRHAVSETVDEEAPVVDERPSVPVLSAIEPADIRALVGIEVLGLEEVDNIYGAQTSEEALRIIQKRLDGVENSCLLEADGNRMLLAFDTGIDRGSQELELVELLMRRPVVVEDNTITLDSCISAVERQKNMDLDEMRASVDFAIKQAKELGQPNIVVFYDSNMRHAIKDREKITQILEEAIKHESFLIFYQPQIALTNNEVVGYEALVRLKDKSYPASQFIPVAEMTGMIVDIDRIVTKRAVEQLAIWKRRNKRVRPISINFSPLHLTQDDDYASFLLGLLKQHNVSSEYIKLEVTEALFTGETQEKAESLVKQLFDAGISIALDNFGVGYTSFADIMSIPASVIKIDKEFVDTFLIDGEAQNFEQLVRLAHGLGRKVVVVGVDKKWQIEACRELECDVVQGYYFSKPLLPENAVQFKPRS